MESPQAIYQQLNEGMKAERFHAFSRNLEQNIPYIEKYGGLRDVPGLLAGKHVVVVGAGASLGSLVGPLKKFWQRRELVIIAADMVLKPLVGAGIFPHFVISCETTPVDFFAGIDTGEMHLLAFSCMNNRHVRSWRGPVSFYNWQMDDPEYRELWERAGIDLGFVATGSIVTTQAAAIALGADIVSLLLGGNDLAFRDRFYAPGTLREAGILMTSNRLSPRESREYSTVRRVREYEIHRQEEKYYTNSQFLAAKTWLEELFGKVSLAVYDASVPGCSGSVVEKISPADYFMQFQRKRRKKR